MSEIEKNSGIEYGWSRGESGWNTGMDENLKLIGRLIHRVAKGVLSSPPSTPQDGDVYLVKSPNSGVFSGKGGTVAAYLNGSWTFYSSPEDTRFFVGSDVYHKKLTSWVLEILDGADLVAGSVPLESLEQNVQDLLTYAEANLPVRTGRGMRKDLNNRLILDDDYVVNLIGYQYAPLQQSSTLLYDSVAKTYDTSGVNQTAAHVGLKRCVVNDAGRINYFLDPMNSQLKEDGSPANLDGSDGQVMVRIPRFFVKHSFSGDVESFSISTSHLPGYVLHPAFFDPASSSGYSYIMISAYDAVLYQESSQTYLDGLNLEDQGSRVDLAADSIGSVSGKYLAVGCTRSEFRQLAANRGEGWSQWDFYAWQAIQMLFVTDYGGLNSQSLLGNGNVYRDYPEPSSLQSDSPHEPNGHSNYLGNSSGFSEDTAVNDPDDWTENPFVSYRGLENLWGQAWKWVDGVVSDDRQLYLTANQLDYGDSLVGHTAMGGLMPLVEDVRITKFQDDPILLLVESASGISDDYVGDNVWTDNGLRVCRVGGDSNDRKSAGIFSILTTNDKDFKSRNIGTRLMFKSLGD